jgi:hypothetical protein
MVLFRETLVKVYGREFPLIDLPENPSLYSLCRRWALDCTDRIPEDAYFNEEKSIDSPVPNVTRLSTHVGPISF